MNNKPEWLIKAEQERDNFNKTKWANYTDAQIEQVKAGSLITSRLNSELQSKYGTIGGPQGYAAMFANLVESEGSEEAAYEWMRQKQKKVYTDMSQEWQDEFHKAGAKVSGKVRGNARKVLCQAIWDELPNDEWFTSEDIQSACEKHGKEFKYYGNFRQWYIDWVNKKVRPNTAGRGILYSKTNSILNSII